MCFFAGVNVMVNTAQEEVTRVFSLHWKEVCFETSFGLAGFTETPEVYFVEQEVHLAGDLTAAARNKGVILQCRMCL